jgi:hypothetical protein
MLENVCVFSAPAQAKSLHAGPSHNKVGGGAIFGFLAVDIGSIPLTIIIVTVICMVATDFIGTVRDTLRQRDDRGPS